MRLVTFEHRGRTGVGVRRGESVLDLAAAAPDLPDTLRAILALGSGTLERIAGLDGDTIPLADIKLLPPIPEPRKLLCIGLNYVDHAAEDNKPPPPEPIVFLRLPTSFVGQGEPIVRPAASDQFDYEVELAVVIGKTGRNIAEADALDFVAGYTIFQDGSLRDYQFRGGQWTLGKNFDHSGSMGPELVTADELPRGGAGLSISARLNGETVQQADTSDMIFSVARLISHISGAITLEPGDVIATGTPAGVGFVRKPPLFLKPGDLLEVEIEGIGMLANPVVGEDQ